MFSRNTSVVEWVVDFEDSSLGTTEKLNPWKFVSVFENQLFIDLGLMNTLNACRVDLNTFCVLFTTFSNLVNELAVNVAPWF